MSDYFDIPRKYYTCPYAMAGKTYGKAKLRVYRVDTGEQILDVFECNAREGWLIKYMRGADGSFMVGMDGEVVKKKMTGMFEIRLYVEDQE